MHYSKWTGCMSLLDVSGSDSMMFVEKRVGILEGHSHTLPFLSFQ